MQGLMSILNVFVEKEITLMQKKKSKLCFSNLLKNIIPKRDDFRLSVHI